MIFFFPFFNALATILQAFLVIVKSGLLSSSTGVGTVTINTSAFKRSNSFEVN